MNDTTDPTPQPEAGNTPPTPEEPPNMDWRWVIVALIFMALGITIQVQAWFHPYPVGLALLSLGIAIVLFGLLRSYANLKKPWDVGGALGGFVVVFMLMNQVPVAEPGGDATTPPLPTPIPNPTTTTTPTPTPTTYGLKFEAPYFGTSCSPSLHPANLEFRELAPVSGDPYRLTPQDDAQARGKYEYRGITMPDPGGQYRARAKPVVVDSFQGAVGGINICFSPRSANVGDPYLSCHWEEICGTVQCLPDDTNAFSQCPVASPASVSFSLFPTAWAADAGRGWNIPSLDVLEELHERDRMTYVAFRVTTDDLRLPENVDRYTAALSVNGSPLYINGWSAEENVRLLDPDKPFTFEFGLQNLDFSGADYGVEHIDLTLTFFDGKTQLKVLELKRDYTALRRVKPTTVEADNGARFAWDGEMHFGRMDKAEVFFWSSTNMQELVERRKVFFDDEDVSFRGREAVAVIRPPLDDNPNFGLALGLVDSLGRIEFTFDAATAADIASWLNNEVKGRRTRHREETGFDHPLIKNVNVYGMLGDG